MGLTRPVNYSDDKNSLRANTLLDCFNKQLNDFYKLDVRTDYDIERTLINNKINELEYKKVNVEEGYYKTSPSSVYKCNRELYFNHIKAKHDVITMYPYQKRWARNGSAVHEYTQRDLLYSERYVENPPFTMERLENGLIAWENNIYTVKHFEKDGKKVALSGMMDGIMRYKDGSLIGFEFKTKSTTLGAIGDYKLKDIDPSHKKQAVAYSLLFDIDEFIFMYESLAKDGWTKGANAKPDIKTFYYRVTDADRDELLNKLYNLYDFITVDRLPAKDDTQCMFCKYKTVCNGVD